ncbi:uncharacterized protein LOC125670627 [Ostrea edulis]|uniref:uncharacterized protein LOC125670627 n=1 Tax=Ostrea edulis TaxID=37623 RepID=UPI0020943619|nr:uncharacterized protein LOC125670627 [Ostrea edulis]
MRTTIYIGFTIVFTLHTNEAFKLPRPLAKQRIAHLLRRDEAEKPKTFEDSDCLSTLKSDGIALVNHGITLLNSSIKTTGRFFEALEDLYSTDINTVLTTVSDTLKKADKQAAVDFKKFMDVDLDKSAIYVYTDWIYDDVNYSLRSHKCGKKKLTEKDKNLAPYTAYLMAVMLYSPNLRKESNFTYREVSFKQEFVDQYKVGTTFLWSSFTSSSMYDLDFTGNVEFVFNNSRESIWSPRRIEEYSRYPEEEEALYPPAAIFSVTEKHEKGNKVYIYADLVSED